MLKILLVLEPVRRTKSGRPPFGNSFKAFASSPL